MDKIKKLPERMCISCKAMYEKNDLIRIVLNKDGQLSLDTKGKLAGRGAYICNNKECITRCCKHKLLNRAYKMEIPSTLYDNLLIEYEQKNKE